MSGEEDGEDAFEKCKRWIKTSRKKAGEAKQSKAKQGNARQNSKIEKNGKGSLVTDLDQ